MATVAIAAEATVVCIIGCVTRITRFRQFQIFHVVDWIFMAHQTIDTFVGAFQFKVRLLVVIECPGFKIIGYVTNAALSTQLPLVRVIFLMTRIALKFGFLKITGTMTFFTCQGRMRSQ